MTVKAEKIGNLIEIYDDSCDLLTYINANDISSVNFDLAAPCGGSVSINVQGQTYYFNPSTKVEMQKVVEVLKCAMKDEPIRKVRNVPKVT